MRWGSDGNRVDAGLQQSIDVLQCGATQGPRHDVPLLTVRVGDSDKTHAGYIRQHAGMIAAHDADADDADFQRVSRYHDCLTHA
jgi:hypothetical protein